MRKSLALKTLFRSLPKTLLTFLLITAASFALFSRVTDYAVTSKETKDAQSLYHAVAYLDNEVSDIVVNTKSVDSKDGMVSTGYGYIYEMEDKPWPSKEEMEKFASLPGVTLADTRYTTAGRAENYKRLSDNGGRGGSIIFEGTYNGYIDDTDPSVLEDHVRLKFEDVKLIASEDDLEIPDSFIMEDAPLGDMFYAKSVYTRAFYDSLKVGSRCLVLGSHSGVGGANSGLYFYSFYADPKGMGEGALCVIDGQPDNYLETEAFALQKKWVDEINHNLYSYDMVYTSDMRAIPGFNKQSLAITRGRSLKKEDTDACVVSEIFLKEHGLSIGDSVSVRLGKRLDSSFIPVGEGDEGVPAFTAPRELVIIGAYAGMKDNAARYSPNSIYVSSALLPVEAPEDDNGFCVFVEDARDIEAFHAAAEKFAEKHDLKLEYSDRGWLDVKDSLRMGALTSLLTMVLYVAGAVLALFLAVYLYIGRNKKMYAIMRMLGVPAKAAGSTVVMPFTVLAVLAIPAGGIAGLSYAQKTAVEALARMADSAPAGYVPDAALPVGVILLCLLSELAFVSLAAYYFLRKMKTTPPLELLHEGKQRTEKQKKAVPVITEEKSLPVRFDASELFTAGDWTAQGNYGAVRHVSAYIWRHMRRGIGKTAVSLFLAVVLAAGVGTFTLARDTYRDAFEELGVKGTATEYAFSMVTSLANTPLVKDFYCHSSFGVRVLGDESDIIMTVTNDLARNMGKGCKVEYAEGYDDSAFEGTAQVCLVGKELAEKLGISPGDEISLLADLLYTVLKDEGGEEAMAESYKPYLVIGVAESEDPTVNNGIFTGIRSDLQRLFSMDFAFDQCEFLLADNQKLEEMETLLSDAKGRSLLFAPNASYHLDTGGLADIKRIRGLLESLFPIAVGAAVLLGLTGAVLIILQSAQEAAFLRIQGVTKKRVWCMLVFEQVILCLAGIALAAGGLALCQPQLFVKGFPTLAVCWALYLLGCFLGALVASAVVTRHRLLELLQVKE